MRYREYRRMHNRDLAGAVGKIALGLILFVILFSLTFWMMREAGWAEKDRRKAENVGVMATSVEEEPANEADGLNGIEIYCEGDGEPPAWYDPDEPMAAAWSAETDDGFIGWGGRRADEWELDLMARIVYLEFLGCSQTCCEAGVDSILRLWESEYFGKTLGETLTATAENGELAYTTYGYVWAAHYDPGDLAWCRSLCEERFKSGPAWTAPFFQLYFYPTWAVPCYEIDLVYFSTFREGTR